MSGREIILISGREIILNELDSRYFKLIFDRLLFFDPEDFEFDYEMGNTDVDVLTSPNVPISNLPHSFVIRLIQLLPSLALRLFSFTSKSNYRNCLIQRGLEFEHYNYDTPELYITKNGRLFLCQRTLPDYLMSYIRPMSLFHINNFSAGVFQKPFRRDYFAVNVRFYSPEFLLSLPEFCHPKIRMAFISLFFKVEDLEQILRCFNEVEEMFIFIKEINPLISIKNCLEKWKSQKTKKLQRFILRIQDKMIIFVEDEFMIMKNEERQGSDVFFATNDFNDQRQDMERLNMFFFYHTLKDLLKVK